MYFILYTHLGISFCQVSCTFHIHNALNTMGLQRDPNINGNIKDTNKIYNSELFISQCPSSTPVTSLRVARCNICRISKYI